MKNDLDYSLFLRKNGWEPYGDDWSKWSDHRPNEVGCWFFLRAPSPFFTVQLSTFKDFQISVYINGVKEFVKSGRSFIECMKELKYWVKLEPVKHQGLLSDIDEIINSWTMFSIHEE